MKQFFRQANTALIVAFLLTGCGLFARNDPDRIIEFYRDVEVEIASTTRFDAQEFAGFWNIRAEFARGGEQPTRAGVDFQLGPDGEIVQIALHGPKRRRRFGVVAYYEVDQAMPGRLVLGDPPFATEYWVLWVDDDYRTAAIGTPSGTFGWIIDRERTGGEDRITAASEILEWVGYDMSLLVDLP